MKTLLLGLVCALATATASTAMSAGPPQRNAAALRAAQIQRLAALRVSNVRAAGGNVSVRPWAQLGDIKGEYRPVAAGGNVSFRPWSQLGDIKGEHRPGTRRRLAGPRPWNR